MQIYYCHYCLVDTSRNVPGTVSLKIIAVQICYYHSVNETKFLFCNTSRNTSEVTSLGIISKENDVRNCAYSDVPLLVKINLFIGRSELTCSPTVYNVYLTYQMNRLIVGRRTHVACLSESGRIQLTLPRSLSGSFIAITIYGDNLQI